MADKKKVATSVAAVATAAALLLGGTFAWQSISQTALNEASDIVNPGGRLHNDMWYVSAEENNNDIYVENFAEDDIFARVRLSEYMEIVLNYGTAGEKVLPVIGSKTEKVDDNGDPVLDDNGNKTYDYEYVRFTDYVSLADEVQAGAADEDGAAYWTWQMGGETVYMPTFNMNKDSLLPDLNGIYEDGNVGTISNRVPADDPEHQYSDWTVWQEGDEKTGNEIWDYDSDMIDELAALNYPELAEIIDPGKTSADAYNVDAEDVRLVEKTHEAKPTGTAQLISMSAWLDMFPYDEETGMYDASFYDPEAHGNYWVYDDSEDGNGWVYWSAKLGGGKATGLLLNGTSLNQVMDDTWYYAINAVGQFCTPDDTGVAPSGTYNLRAATDTDLTEGTGFYADGETVTAQALEFLRILGMTDTTPGYDGGEDDGSGDYLGMTLYVHIPEEDNANYLIPNEPYDLIVYSTESEDTEVTFTVAEQTWDYETGEEKLVPLTAGGDYTLSPSSAQFEDYTYDYDETIVKKAEAKLTITNEDLLGKYIVVTATGNETGNKTRSESKSVSWEQIDAEILFYKASGAHVTPDAGTGYGAQVAEKEIYDIVVNITAEGEKYTVYSTCPEDYPVSPLVSVELGESTTPIINHVQWSAEGNPYENYLSYTESTINDNGQLVVGDKVTYGGVVSKTEADGGTTYYDDLMISATCNVVKIYESEDAKNSGADPKSIEYATGDWQLYPIGAEVLEFDCMYNGEDQQFYTVIAAHRQTAGQMMYVYDGNDNNCTDKVTFTLTGKTSGDTTIVKKAADENSSEPYALLTLGSNETAEMMTVTAALDDGSKASATVKVTYAGLLRVDNMFLQPGFNETPLASSNEKLLSYSLHYQDYNGSVDENATFALSEWSTYSEDTKIEGTTLTLAKGESGTIYIVVYDGKGNPVAEYCVEAMPDETSPAISKIYPNVPVTTSDGVATVYDYGVKLVHNREDVSRSTDDTMTVAFYGLSSKDQSVDEATLLGTAHVSFIYGADKTGKITTKTINVAWSEDTKFTDKRGSFSTFMAEQESLSLIFNYEPDETIRYLKVVVTDRAGNKTEGSLSLAEIVAVENDNGQLDSLEDIVELQLARYSETDEVTWYAESDDIVVTPDESDSTKATVKFKTFEGVDAPSDDEYTITACYGEGQSATYVVAYAPTMYTIMHAVMNPTEGTYDYDEITAGETKNLDSHRYLGYFCIKETAQVRWVVTDASDPSNVMQDDGSFDESTLPAGGTYTVQAVYTKANGETGSFDFTVETEAGGF